MTPYGVIGQQLGVPTFTIVLEDSDCGSGESGSSDDGGVVQSITHNQATLGGEKGRGEDY